MSFIGNDEDEKEPIWKQIIDKILPFITKDDIINMDLESFSAMINRLYGIKEITEQEMSYAKKNRDLILIRMGLLHNIPDLTEKDLELGLRQLSVRLASYYYNNNEVDSLEAAENKVLETISKGFSKTVTVSLNPDEAILKLREYLSDISKITLENAPEIVEALTRAKDNLMNIGVSGLVFYDIDRYCQMLKRTIEEELPTKNDIVEASFEWQLKIQK